MSKEDSIEVTDGIREIPSGLFSVNWNIAASYWRTAGRLRRNRIRVLAGDKGPWNCRPTISQGQNHFSHR